MSHVPDWWAALLLALAAFRVWRLLAYDSILDQPRARLLRGRKSLGEFVICPWCLGAWLSLAWWGAWLEWPHGTTVAAVPFALSAVVGLVARLDP